VGLPMAQEPGSNRSGNLFENWGRLIEERLGAVQPRIEEEVKKATSYLNDEVVPHLRRDSSQALRAAAGQLRKLADQLDDGLAGRSDDNPDRSRARGVS
jgi:hypothetical protein